MTDQVANAAALRAAMDDGILRGAGLDVLEGEEVRTLLENHELMGREDVVVTPHIGFDSVEAVQRITKVTAANVAAFLAGQPENLR